MNGLEDVGLAVDAFFDLFSRFWSWLLGAGIVGMAVIMLGLLRRILRLMDKFRR